MVRPVMGVAVLAAAAIGEGMKDEQIGACASCQVLDLITHMSKSISGIEKVYFLSSFWLAHAGRFHFRACASAQVAAAAPVAVEGRMMF